MSEPIYSIITPHKNQPLLLERLLNSIPRRNDIEIIIIDDNSDIDIVDFDHFPGNDRENVNIIFNKECKGPGHARNLGMKEAKGKWILFADADDFFTPYINEFLNKFANSEADMVFFNAICLDSETYLPGRRANRQNKRITLYSKDRDKSLTLLRYTFGEPWCKLIKRNILVDNNIKFPHRIIHEDTELSYQVGFYSKKFEVENKAVYCLTFREGSLSYSPNEEKRLARIEAFAKAEKFFKDNNITVPFVNPMWFHYYQLCWSRFQNKDTYTKGFNKMLELGFTKGHIYNGMLKLFPRFLVVKLASMFISNKYIDI